MNGIKLLTKIVHVSLKNLQKNENNFHPMNSIHAVHSHVLSRNKSSECKSYNVVEIYLHLQMNRFILFLIIL
jgi:hypothetical protein